ncbi:MAG: peptidase M15D vanX D-ala-D-ala dipeptidase [Luteitalea sp.]|nr:peptidase M15D vanX D-ala-D-ala dipeptidase [Luteitalea sp.]
MTPVERPIPRLPLIDTRAYRSVPIRMSPDDDSDPLQALADVGIVSDAYYARNDGTNAPYGRRLPGAELTVRARRGVVQRLLRVNRRLSRMGVEVVVLDGFRPIECQRALWRHFVRLLKHSSPGLSAAEAEQRVLKYVADPRRFSADDSRTWPSHITGGAVDLTLRRRSGTAEQLFMGGVFDDPSRVSHTAFFERPHIRMSVSDQEARKNRRLLYWTMRAEGFANLPTEWWHYDWGTQLWAFVRGQEQGRPVAAMYRPVV